ncbi:ABC transporter [Streptomyces sp. NPDC047108]|uniref:ABC transporter n=1 Tax=Streptomyces sp. NPDC047108 TaxID=3155025 RepID=UPI0033C5F7A0
MIPLLRYQLDLLLRSQRWLPPFLLYAAFVLIGVRSGEPILDSLGYASAALLPTAIWMVRACVSNEAPAARHCTTAATGPARVHLAKVLTAMLATGALGVLGTAVVAFVSDPHSAGHRTAVPVLPAAGAGLLTALSCVLLGIAAGALCAWPVMRSSGWGISIGAFAALLLLVVGASPANAAVSGMVTGSPTGVIHVPWLPFAGAALLAAAATAASCGLSSRRT